MMTDKLIKSIRYLEPTIIITKFVAIILLSYFNLQNWEEVFESLNLITHLL